MYQKMSIYRKKKKSFNQTNPMQFSLYVERKRSSTKEIQKIREPDIPKNVPL